MLRYSLRLLAKDKDASLAAKHAGKRAPPSRENTVDFQPLAYRFLGNYWKLKQKRPKSEQLIAAEKEFLAERRRAPEGFVNGFTKNDVDKLDPSLRLVLSLRCASNADISKARKAMMIEKFGRGPLDSSSPGVRIAILTEKILNLRAHLIVHAKDQPGKRRMSIYLGARGRMMRLLYRSDFPFYQWVCKELGIRCVRFAIPIKDPQYAFNPMAVDGDRAKFLIRQRMWRGKHRPRHEPAPNKRGSVLYTKPAYSTPPKKHGKPKSVPQQISKHWPLGVPKERVKGKHVIDNPTAPGKGHVPASIAW